MKKLLLLSGLMAILAGSADVYAQGNRKPKPKPKPKAAVTTPKVDTAVVVAPPPPPAPPKDTIPVKNPVVSRRPTTTVTGNLVQDKTPLPYDNIRIDDQVYKQIVWRVIDTRERMNLPFRYEADENNGSQMFINILLKHLKDGDITAFDASNDRFTTPLMDTSIARMLVGSSYTVDVPDIEKDPTGTLGITKPMIIRQDFDENSIRSFAIKEEIIFDRETSRLHFRILGIAPLKTIFETDGSERASYRLFWIYYPELRPFLAKYEAYNPRNMAARMSWEEVFESRYFSSYIYKTTMNNPFDKPLEGLIKDPLMRLLEGEKIKETIFNWEQDQWSY